MKTMLILIIVVLVVILIKKSKELNHLKSNKIAQSIKNTDTDHYYYNNTEIQYVKEGSYIKIRNEWYKLIYASSRYSATMKVKLLHETDGNEKEIEVSPNYRVNYRVKQTL